MIGRYCYSGTAENQRRSWEKGVAALLTCWPMTLFLPCNDAYEFSGAIWERVSCGLIARIREPMAVYYPCTKNVACAYTHDTMHPLPLELLSHVTLTRDADLSLPTATTTNKRLPCRCNGWFGKDCTLTTWGSHLLAWSSLLSPAPVLATLDSTRGLVVLTFAHCGRDLDVSCSGGHRETGWVRREPWLGCQSSFLAGPWCRLSAQVEQKKVTSPLTRCTQICPLATRPP